MSLLFFGGVKEIVTREKVGQFKNGKDKYKNITKQIEIKGLGLKPHHTWKGATKGIYSTNESVLQCIAKREDTDAGKISNLLLKIRYLNKQIDNYYSGTETYIYDWDNCVHPEFCHCGYDKSYSEVGGGTDTGRLSSRNINAQNQPKSYDSNVREHFISRYENGILCEADFSQIEIAVQAELSGCANYINDVINGVDFHIKRLALKEHLSYIDVYNKIKVDKNSEWIQLRSKIKEFSFSRAYGAGAKSISEKTGMTIEEIEQIIENEEIAYPGLTQFNKNLKRIVDVEGQYQSPFGRIWKFKKYPSKFKWQIEKGILESYAPQQIINYPIQGTATGDISMIMIGKFWREKAIFNRDKYLMINTVHDSLLMDCKKEYIEACKKDLYLLDKVQDMMYTTFKYNWKVPIKIDIKVGINWHQCGLE